MLLTVHAKVLDKIPFFKNKHPQFLECLIPKLKLEYYAAAEFVIWQHDHSTEVYFIAEGMLEVCVHVVQDVTGMQLLRVQWLTKGMRATSTFGEFPHLFRFS